MICLFDFTINPKKRFRSNIALILTTLLFLILTNIQAQDTSNSIFGKGIKIVAKDSSFYMKFSTRIQNRYDGIYTNAASSTFEDRFYLRRARLKFDGFVHSPRLIYKIEFDMVNAQFLDAVVKWNLFNNFYVWFGQTKLPGNVERVISSQKLQFVDRSLLNSRYNIDRDKGVQFRNHHYFGKMLIREQLSLSQGEGRNFIGFSEGHDYTARLEFLPMGSFTSGGDYFASDLSREQKPKLMLGITYDFNDNSVREGGQLGEILSESRDLETIFIDLMFKYHGWSIMAEYANKAADDGNPVILDTNNNITGVYSTGEGLNMQLGYLFANNFELAYRYTSITADTFTGNNAEQHTVGFSRYIVGHSLKVQSDISLLTKEDSPDEVMGRLQVELSF